MRRFVAVVGAIERTNSTARKVEALADYFREAPHEDAAWALFFLSGRRVKRLMPSRVLWELLVADSRLPEWMLEHCVAATGDFAETIGLLGSGVVETDVRRSPHGTGDGFTPAPEPDNPDQRLHVWVRDRVLALKGRQGEQQRAAVREACALLGPLARATYLRMLTGEFQVGASKTLVLRALARAAGLSPDLIAHRFMGEWEPEAEAFAALCAPAAPAQEAERPYPFCLASPLDAAVETLGPRQAWLAEWKWDGIRAQLVQRGGRVALWSRGEERIEERFPELRDAAARLPAGTVLDGEVLGWRGGPLPFADLQQRIGRKRLSAKVLAACPVRFVAWDLLELGGEDWRPRPLTERRSALERLVALAGEPLDCSPVVAGEDWDALFVVREGSRARGVEGLMLKRLASAYGVGRRRGDWWKWKIAPLTMDVVLVYAHPGHGKRASLYTDYTFAVWDGPRLVPIARAYSGLTDAEIRELDGWVRDHTRQAHGPTRAVEPVRVYELGFEAITASKRHAAGLAVRFPRILRERIDKRPEQADTLDTMRALLAAVSRPSV